MRQYLALRGFYTMLFAIGITACDNSNTHHNEHHDVINPNPYDTNFNTACPAPAEPHRLPFTDYAISNDRVKVQNPAHPDARPVTLLIGPESPRVWPHGNEPFGAHKANHAYIFVDSPDEFTSLDGGDCSISTHACGLPAEELDSRLAPYSAPSDAFHVTSVRFMLKSDVEYYTPTGYPTDNGKDHWLVEGWGCSELGQTYYSFGHIWRIADDLAEAMIAAGYEDPRDYVGEPLTSSPSPEYITGEPVIIGRQHSMAWPHTLAKPVFGHPGYFHGDGFLSATPYSQVEYVLGIGGYWPLSAEEREQLQSVLIEQAIDENQGSATPLAPHYQLENAEQLRWRWASELNIDVPGLRLPHGHSLMARQGSWWEAGPANCEKGKAIGCNQIWVFAERFNSKANDPAYFPDLYYSPDSAYLISQYRYDRDNVESDIPDLRMAERWWHGEVLWPGLLDPQQGQMVMVWRARGDALGLAPGDVIGYQALSYNVSWNEEDADGGSARFGVSPIFASEAEAHSALPAIPSEQAQCDGQKVLCMNSNKAFFSPSGD